MKTNTLRAKLLNCFFAFTLVFGLCIPSIGTYAYANPTDEITNDTVAAHVEGSDTQGENQSNDVGGDNGTGADTGNGAGDTNNLGDGVQGETTINDDTNTGNNDNNGTETEVATTQADEIIPMAADATVGSMTISGGTLNTDFTISGTTVVVKTSTPLTLSGTLTNGSIQIQQGASANITLNGVTITSNTQSSPINLMGAGTTLRLTLADGSDNNLSTSAACAGIHCGEGSTLYIDDSIANWSGNTHIEVLNGVVDTTATLDSGVSVVKGDPVTRLAPSSPNTSGTLVVKGGPDAAGIGSGPNEISGNMIFDGGDITVYAFGGNANNGGYSSGSSSSGSGIGGGAKGSGTNMWFNGARIHAYGSYHGAGIGGGWSSSSGSGSQTGTSTTASTCLCSNIYINAGYLYSEGYDHGNGFGGGCGSPLTKRIVRVTGGTLHPVSKGSKKDIGGQNGYTIVTGGSAFVSAKTKFEGKGDTAYNTQGVTTWSDVEAYPSSSLPDADKVFMLTVDLSTSSEKLKNEKLESFKLYIGGEDAHYGAPTEFENGKLYLWLPEWVAKPNAEKEVRIEMSVRQNDGTIKTIDPLFIAKPSSSDTTQTVKRYIEFDFPADYAKTLEKDYDGLPFPALTVDAQHPINIEREVGNSIVEETLDSPDDVKFKYQMLTQNEEGDWVPTGSESEEGAATLPTDTGKFQVTMTSYQYANHPNYAASYWGHQAKGVATIKPVPAALTIEENGVQWGHLDTTTNTWSQITQDQTTQGKAGNRLRLAFNIHSANTTAPTCAAPTGSFQVKIDGKNVGKPIPLTKEAVEASGGTFNNTDKINIVGPNGENQSRSATQVLYYLDPTNQDGLLELLESAGTGGEHKINIEYIADKNYIQGVDKNPENAKDDETFIVPVPPEGDVAPTDPDINVDPTDPDDPTPGPGEDDPVDPDSKTRIIQRTITVPYSKFHQASQPDLKDFFNLEITSSSSAPFLYNSTNPAVAGFVKDGDGNVTLTDGAVGIQVNSCGTSVLTLEQKPNALYTGTKYILTVKVVPDATIKPFVQIRVVTNNLTHPGMPAAPGDEIEYLVTGLNTTPGSSWQAAHLLDTMDSRLTLKEDSVKLASNYSTPNLSGNESHDYMLGTEAFYNGFDWSSLTYTDLAKGQYDFDKNANKVSKGVGSVYGGQSTTLRFVATLQSGTADRPQNPSDPEDIKNEPEGTGGYGKEEIDLKPGEDMPDTTPLTPGKDIVVVGEPSAPDEPVNPDNPGGDEPNPIPSLPVIPKDPVLPGTDPTDPDNPDNPDNPSGDNKSDISVVKSAKNLTHPEGNKALVGDTIEYSITVENKGKDTCYYWPIIKDTLPTGLKPVAGSFELTKVDGTTIAVSDSCYQTSTHTISLYVDDLYGNEKTTLTFKCTVTPEAADIANTAQVIGTTPSDKWKGEHPDPIVEPDDDPETSYIKFDANGGEGAPVGIEGQTSSSITAPFPTTEPTREGYEFVGWNTQANGCGLGITSYPSKFLSKPGSIYYYAQWKKATSDDPGIEPGDPTPEDPTQFSYFLFAANGGTNAPEGIKGKPGSTITDEFPKAIPTAPEGYKFVGWYTAKTDGNKVEGYPPEFPAITDADNTTKPTTTYYYAHWQKIEDPTNTTPPAGDPDPINPLEFTYIKFDANGGKFVTPVTAQAEGDTTTPTWSTKGLTGSPNGSISEDQKKTFPSKEYGPVERKGYTFTGWNTKADGTGEKVTAYGDTLPASGTTYYYAQWVKDPEPTWPPTPGQPFSPDPKIPASEYPWDDPDNPFDWDKYLEDTPKIDTPEPADVGKVMPADPDYKDLRITLSAKNETRMDGYTYVGDEVTYTILIENLSSPEKSWLDVIARADIPEGLKFIPGSIYLTAANGEVIHVNDNVYNDVTRILALNAGDLAGGQTVKVVFKAEVTVDAINKDIGMTSYAYGTLPSEFDVNDESYVKPEIGSAFDPGIGGWALYDFNHKSIFNPEKVYPSKYVTAQNPPLGTPEQQAEAAKLAKTGDTTTLVALGVGALAVAAGVALVVARRRMKKNGR